MPSLPIHNKQPEGIVNALPTKIKILKSSSASHQRQTQHEALTRIDLIFGIAAINRVIERAHLQRIGAGNRRGEEEPQVLANLRGAGGVNQFSIRTVHIQLDGGPPLGGVEDQQLFLPGVSLEAGPVDIIPALNQRDRLAPAQRFGPAT